jgi:aryl-alcohol dehydrogenase-like predicted oxidoreductase
VSDRVLGRSAVQVAPIGLGTMGIGGTFARDAGDDAACVRGLHAGLDGGRRLVDTAPGYGDGHAETLLGRALAGRRASAIVATKFPPAASTPAGVTASLEGSLRRLRTDYVDLLQVHWPCYDVPFEDTLEAMHRLVEAGTVRALGLGNCTRAEARRALATPAGPAIVSIQLEYSLVDRSVEAELLPFCREHALTLIASSPLGCGRLATIAGAAAVAEIAAAHGVTPAQIALAWLIDDSRVVAIPKAGRPAHQRENLAAAAVRLTAPEWQRIAAAFHVPIARVAPGRIVVEPESDRPVYTTLAEARANALGIVPGPAELARQMTDGEMLKPIKVRPLPGAGAPRFRLTEGRTRYWGWVIAHGDAPIPAIVEETR